MVGRRSARPIRRSSESRRRRQLGLRPAGESGPRPTARSSPAMLGLTDAMVSPSPQASSTLLTRASMISADPGRVVRRPGGSGGRVRKNERTHPVRVGRGEQRSHQRSLVGTQQHGALDPDGIHDRAHVGHPLLEERQSVDRNRIRETDPPLVERDHATERRQPAEVVRKAREVPRASTWLNQVETRRDRAAPRPLNVTRLGYLVG